MKTFKEFVEQKLEKSGKWLQNAINPEHEGFCSPITKSTCTPHRKALALRFKKGGDLHHKKKKKK